jgi:tetratricopeptide (TPR) repeat protein
VAWAAAVLASPYTPTRDEQVLATVAAGASHSTTAAREHAAARLDAALPLAQFYIQRARDTGDMRFLGYADATLARWRDHVPAIPAALALDATILQSRHAFTAALQELDRALEVAPDDAQAWLARATVLRVLGRYGEAQTSCRHLQQADRVIAELCAQSVHALQGQLPSAYRATAALPGESLPEDAQAWRYSLLAEMAVSLGDAAAAKTWFAAALGLRPADAYTRAAYADLLLEEGRAGEALGLLEGHESVEPLLLRVAIAQARLHDPRLAGSRALLASAFRVEEQRGEMVHRREQARFCLDVVGDAPAALQAAEANWQVQREPADVLLLLRAARAAGRPGAAAPALRFLRQNGTEDVRFGLDHRGAS